MTDAVPDAGQPGAAGQPQATGQRATIGIVFAILFLDLVTFGMLFPLVAEMLAFYQTHDRGLLAAAMDLVAPLVPNAGPIERAALFGGLIGAVYSGLQFFAAPFWGRISDRIGRRPVLLIALTGTLLANLLFLVAADFTLLLLARLFAGAMSGCVGAAQAAVADITPPEQRGRAMGLLGMAFGLGFVLGPAIGGLTWLIGKDWWHGTQGLALHTFSCVALVAAILSAANLLWALRSLPETLARELRGVPSDASQRSANPFKLFAPGLGAPLARVAAVGLLYTLLFSGMEATLVFLADHRLDWSPAVLGGLFAGMGLMSAAFQGAVFRRQVARHGPRRLALLGLALMLPGFLLLSAVGGAWFALLPPAFVLCLGAGCLAAGAGLVFPGLTTLVSLAADARSQGLASGTFRSATSLGRALGPLLGASLYFAGGPAAPYLVAGIGVLVPFAVLFSLRPAAHSAEPFHS